MEGTSGSVILFQHHINVNREMAQQRRQGETQRLEMADNNQKRTRHPFSGYTEILYRDRTTPVKRLTYKGKPKPVFFIRSVIDRDNIMMGAGEVEPLRPDQQHQPQIDPPDEQLPEVLPADVRQLRGFQQPKLDPQTGEYIYTTLTAEGEQMFANWIRFLPPQFHWIANDPDKVHRFYQWIEGKLRQGEGELVYEWLLGRINGTRDFFNNPDEGDLEGGTAPAANDVAKPYYNFDTFMGLPPVEATQDIRHENWPITPKTYMFNRWAGFDYNPDVKDANGFDLNYYMNKAYTNEQSGASTKAELDAYRARKINEFHLLAVQKGVSMFRTRPGGQGEYLGVLTTFPN